MEKKGFHRKLTAILSADVAGYSRLMQDDEAATVETLETYKQIISDLTKQHRGRVVDSPGDNLLAEFASVVDAVQCAVAVQKELQSRNAELPDARRMLFRIGVNLGDVIEEGSRIYGDGVNIAARLESLAEPGGICVSKTAFDQIETKLPFGYAYLGEQTVKNIAKPVGAYTVLLEPRVISARKTERSSLFRKRRAWIVAATAVVLMGIGGGIWNFYWHAPKIEPASPEKMAFPLPDKPSIAVLPLANKSEDPKMDLFCDGMTANIISALARDPKIMVIARASTSTFKGKPLDVKQVSESLGVQYILEGNIQRSGERVRITAQMFDALKGSVEWAETYDRDLSDTFALQDEIAIKVLGSVRAGLGAGFHPSSMQKYFKGKQGLECYYKLMEGNDYVRRWNLEDNNRARQLAEESLSMCPDTPDAFNLLGWTYHHAYFLTEDVAARGEALEKSIELGRKAISLDDKAAGPWGLLSSCYLITGELEKALTAGERAVAVSPNSLEGLVDYGDALVFLGRYNEAIPNYQKAIRINPLGHSSIFRQLGFAYVCNGQLEDAVSALKASLQRAPKDFLTHVYLAVAYSMLGREKEASEMNAEVFKMNPKFTIETRVATLKDQKRKDEIIAAFRKAGLPDKVQKTQP
jgi:adenylate cyclase